MVSISVTTMPFNYGTYQLQDERGHEKILQHRELQLNNVARQWSEVRCVSETAVTAKQHSTARLFC